MAYTYPVAAVGSIFLSTMRHQHVGQILRNQFHWRLEQNTNNRSIEVVYNALDTEMNKVDGIFAKMRLLREDDCVLLDTAHQHISPSRFAGKGFIKNVGGSVITAGIDVTQLAAVLTRRSVVATRRGTSSLHIPLAADPTTIDAGVLSAVSLAAVGDIGNAILNTGSLGDGISVRPIIYHRGATPLYDYIETFIVQPQVRVVRRRTVGLGE